MLAELGTRDNSRDKMCAGGRQTGVALCRYDNYILAPRDHSFSFLLHVTVAVWLSRYRCRVPSTAISKIKPVATTFLPVSSNPAGDGRKGYLKHVYNKHACDKNK